MNKQATGPFPSPVDPYVMVGDPIIGEDPSIRISVGGTHRPRSRELLQVTRESDTSVPAATVGSTGHAGLEPLVTITRDGRTALFSQCSTKRLRAALDELDGGSLPTDGADAVVEHDPDAATLPTPDDGPLAVGERRVLGSAGWAVPASIEDHRAAGVSVAPDVDPSEAISRLRDAGLRGRGRGDASADAPVAAEWETVSGTGGAPVVVVNANEADDRAAADRLLLETAPLSVLEPALAAAHAVDATDLVVYINEDQTLARERAEAAADALSDEYELDASVSIRAVTGPDEYKAGEPTMALEALEGNHRIEARRGPPGPSEYGLDGRPTLVHTPRTFAQVGRVLAGEDPGGASSDPGTRLFTVGGDVRAQATVELPTDASLEDALPAVTPVDGRKAACVGGVFGGVTRSLDVPASAPGLQSARLGTNGAVELLGESTCMVRTAGERAQFANEENCGRCVPCREGATQLVEMLRSIYDGEYKDGMLRELARDMRETSMCGFGVDAPRPVTTAMETFETEFDAHAEGRCPSGACSPKR